MDHVGRIKELLDLMDLGPPERWGNAQAFEFQYLQLIQLWVGFELELSREETSKRVSRLYHLFRGGVPNYFSSDSKVTTVARKMKTFRALVDKEIIRGAD